MFNWKIEIKLVFLLEDLKLKSLKLLFKFILETQKEETKGSKTCKGCEKWNSYSQSEKEEEGRRGTECLEMVRFKFSR